MKTALLILGLSVCLACAEAPQLGPEKALKDAEEELAVVSKKLAATLTDEVAFKDFNRAQGTWIQFRDVEAAFLADLKSHGGDPWTSDYFRIRTRLTVERTKQLLEHIKRK